MSKEKLVLDSFKNFIQERDPERKKVLAEKFIEKYLETNPIGEIPKSLKEDNSKESMEKFDAYVRLKSRTLVDGMKRIYFEHSVNN